LVSLSITAIYTKPQKPFPSFSPYFVANYERTTYEYSPSGVVSNHNVALNANESKAYAEVVTTSGTGYSDGHYWLILKPVGADPNSPATKDYVLFTVVNETVGKDKIEACSYTTMFSLGAFPVFPSIIFPSLWKHSNTIQMLSWFLYDDTMNYIGNTTHEGITVDQWNSTKTCAVFDQEPQSCYSLSVKINDAVPVLQKLSHQKAPDSFEEDWLQIEYWLSYSPIRPIINPPSQWLTTCYNSENGFNIDPVHGYVSCPQGNDNFTISLTAPPVSTLGNVNVQLTILASSCTDCITFQTLDHQPLTSLTFTASNWNTPQRVVIVYLKEGETYFYPSATGGGYEIKNWAQGIMQDRTSGMHLRGVSCGNCIPGYGCK